MINRKLVATVGLVVPATMALGMSADTSFRFLGSVLEIVDPAERGVLTCTAEVAVIALTLYAWATSTRTAAWIAYAVVLVQALPAFEVSGGYGGLVRMALGPVLLVVLLHMLLGLELRMSRVRPTGLLADALREVRERLVAYLGIGRRGTDSAEIARSRAADRAVLLVDRVAVTTAGSRRHARRSAALARALDAARHGLDASDARDMEAAIVARVVRRKSVAGLAEIQIRHDWAGAVRGPETPVLETRPAPSRRTVPVRRPAVELFAPGTVDETKDLLTATEAASVASQARGGKVSPSTIRTWKHRGHLVPVIEDDMTLYRRDDVLAAATRNATA